MAVRMERSEQNPNRAGEVNWTDANFEMFWKREKSRLVGKLRFIVPFLTSHPKKKKIQVHPDPQKTILFGNSVFADVIRWYHTGFGVGPKSNNLCPYKSRRNREEGMWRQSRQRLELRGHKQRNARSHQKMEEVGKDSSLESPEEHGLSDTLISNFWPPALWENKFLLYETTWTVVLCYGSPGKSTQ